MELVWSHNSEKPHQYHEGGTGKACGRRQLDRAASCEREETSHSMKKWYKGQSSNISADSHQQQQREQRRTSPCLDREASPLKFATTKSPQEPERRRFVDDVQISE